jgi:hypothetical protein
MMTINKHFNGALLTDLERLHEFTDFMTQDGKFKIRSYEEIKDYPQEVVSGFCVKQGFYGFPTLELIDFLKEHIDSERVLEIGSGNGVLCKALNIKGTDSFMQKQDNIAELYNMMGQTPISYGDHVIRYDAIDAVRRYKPDIVVASWVTHMYDAKQHYRGGNAWGVREEKILEKVKKYIFIGNDNVHKLKPILEKEHLTYKFPWLVSRSLDKEGNSIWIWGGEKR